MGCGASSSTAGSRPSSSELSSYSGQRGLPQWELEAARVHKATEGFSVDLTTVVEVLARLRNGQRQKLRRMFQETYGKDLLELLSSSLSGSSGEAILALLHPPASYDAQTLHSAVRDEHWPTVTEVLVSRDSDMLDEIRDVYLQEYSISLDDDLSKIEPMDLQKLLMSLSKVDRQFARKKANKQAAMERARRLHEDKDLVKLLCEALSKNQLRQTFSAFEYLYKVTMKGFIEAHFSEWTEPATDALKSYVTCLESSAVYFARQMKKTVDVMSVDDSKLIRIAVSRSELDLYYIRKQFLSIYGKSLEDVIRKTCASDFADVLTTIVTFRGQYSESARRR